MGNDRVNMICDSHMHFNHREDDPLEDLREYMVKNHIIKGTLIINTRADYNLLKMLAYDEVMSRLNIVIGLNKNDCFIEDFQREFDFKTFGIKIHPRLYEIKEEEIQWYVKKIKEICSPIIVIDDFYYGSSFKDELYLELICQLARELKKAKIVVAHAGGVNLLKHVMCTKTYDNVFYDISLTINYLKYSSIEMDIRWMIEYMSHRIMLGSDYPDFTIQQAYEQLGRIGEGDLDAIKMRSICNDTYEKVYTI